MEFFSFFLCFGMEGWSCHGWDGAGRMGWEMLDGRMIEKDGGGGGGGGEREYTVRSHGRHYGKRRICCFRVEIQVEKREGGNDRFLPSREFHLLFFGQHRRKFCAMVV